MTSHSKLRCRVAVLAAFLATAAGATGPRAVAADAEVSVVDRPPDGGARDLYRFDRAPLLPNRLAKLPAGSVRARGWLLTQLGLMRDGMFGKLPEISRWCRKDGNAWLSPTGAGENGWEELPYWLRGLVSLASVLDDPILESEARIWLAGAISSERPNGSFGPAANLAAPDIWPNMLVLQALTTYHEATGDGRVVPFLLRYCRWLHALPRERLLPASWQKVRGADNLKVVHWLYNVVGEPWLLELAQAIHDRTLDWTAGVPNWHGVNICQSFRGPAQFYQQSKDPRHLEATTLRYREVIDLYGQVPGGMFAADENCRPGRGDPRQAAEACSMAEMMFSQEILLGITGDPLCADRCEDVAFNSLPAALTPDLKALHYLTAPNMVRLDKASHSPGLENGGCMLAYSPGEVYRCCQHNVAFSWPYFTEHLWMATGDGGLAAVLYAPSAVDARVAGGRRVRIEEDTEYPFRETIRLTVHATAPIAFPLYLRVPGWCRGARLSLNGAALAASPVPSRYLRIERSWADGDRIELELPMQVKLRVWEKNHGAVSVDRGPLTYSLKIGERWERSGGTDAWPEWEVFATTPWNYGLVLDAADPARSFDVTVRAGPLAPQPFTLDAAPVEIRARARRIPAWDGLDRFGLVRELQASPALTTAPLDEVVLVPMGCARLRIASFPVAGDGPGAVEWKLPPAAIATASHEHDSIEAVHDGILPKDSNDHSIPRFTWWPRLGTREWISIRLKEPRAVSACEVYWFDDTGAGRCRVPAAWKVLAKDGERWVEVKGASGYGTRRDAFNSVRFEAVRTAELRLEVELEKDFTAGVLEWRVP